MADPFVMPEGDERRWAPRAGRQRSADCSPFSP